MRGTNVKEICWMTVLTILCIICFPINPLVLTGVIEPRYYLASFILGWVVWAIGMVLVMAPIILFPRRGGVPRRKSFVHTTRLVDTGIYAVVRHPQRKIICPYHSTGGHGHICRCQAPPIFGGNSVNIRHYIAILSSLAICYLRYPRSCHSLFEH